MSRENSKTMISEITQVTPMEKNKLKVNLENGSLLVIDFNRKVMTARFGILKEQDVWYSVTSNGQSIDWNGYVSLSLSEALEIVAEK